MAQPVFDRWIDRYAARIRLGEFLQRAAQTGAAYLFGFGAVVLAVKLSVPQAWPHVLWGAFGLIPAWGVAWWMAVRSDVSRSKSAARLDSALGSGGLLMMLSELPDSEQCREWSRALPQIETAWKEAIPRVRPRRFASVLALPVLFAASACFVPLREGTTAVAFRNTVGQQAAQELEALLDSIDEERILDEQERQQLHEEIQRLTDQTRETPLTHETWETVDALRERMKIRIESAAVLASGAAAALALLSESNSSDAGDPSSSEVSREGTERLEQELGDAVQKLMQQGSFSKAPRDLQDRLAGLTKNGKLSLPGEAGERQAVLDQLKEFLEQENQKLADLRKKCAACKSGCKSGESECDADGNCSATSNRQGNRPGRGGVTRGRGDAELTWGDEAEKQGAKFKEVVLPKGFLDLPKDEIVALEKSAPDEQAATDAPRSARRDDGAAAGQATWNRKLNPRHRNAVRKYFDVKKP